MQAIRSGGERDALGRVTESKHYDATNFRTRIVQVYDGLGRETKHCVSKVPDGPCTTSTASTAASTMEYDSLGRRTLWTDGNGGTWRATYDSAGNLLGQDDPVAGQHRVFCYDPLNRVVRTLTIDDDTLEDPIAHATRCGEANPAATAVADYSYDERTERGCSYYARGRLCAIDERQGTDVTLATVFTYDARGRVVSEGVTRRLVVGGRTLTPAATVVYAYDAADRQKGVVVPTSSSAQSQTVTTRYDDLGRIRLLSAAGQTFARDLRYDRFGRLTAWTDGGGVTERATYDQSGAGRFRLSALSVSGPGTQAPVLQALGFSMYDAAGNLTALGDTTPESTYASDSPLRNAWSYAYDGLGRLVLASRNSEPVTLYAYDGLGNRTRAGALVSFYDNAAAPQRVQAVTPGGAVSHDPSGSVTGLPALGAAAARTLGYDAEGRLAMVTGGGAAVRFVHDARGQRVARIVNEGAAGEQVTVYYGRWFEVTGGTLTRHIYLGERRIGHSPVAAPSGLTLARGYDGERAVVLARAMEAAVRRDGWARPRVAVEAAEAAAALTVIAGVGLVLIVVRRRWWDEGTRSPEYGRRVRLGMVGRLARGPVVLVVVVVVSALLPWPRLRVVWAGSVSPPPVPPSYPVYFAHTDHLGSTLLLTCHLAGAACPDGTVARRFRYNAYGQPVAYTASGQSASLTAAVPGSNYVPEHLYTGQRWVSAAALYDYGARFYDPQLVQFVSQDPVREYVQAYAYVGWNPVRYTDPTGMFVGLGGEMAAMSQAMPIQSFFYHHIAARDFASTLQYRGVAQGGFNGPGGGGRGGGFGLVGGGLRGGLAEMLMGILGGERRGCFTGLTSDSTGALSSLPAFIAYLGLMLKADVIDAMGFVYGTIHGVVEGAIEIAEGVMALDAGVFGEGLYDAATAAFPRLGSHGGLNWPGTHDNSALFPASGSKANNASIAHDLAVGRSGFMNSAVHAAWISAAWTGPGVEPGIFGQAYRGVGTAAFGAASGILWAAGY